MLKLPVLNHDFAMSAPLSENIKVAALYKFTHVPAPEELITQLRRIGDDAQIKGTLLVANEGLNGTIAGSPEAIDGVIASIRDLDGLDNLEAKYSFTDEPPFGRFKVRLKKEIVTMGVPDIDPRETVGEYVDPSDWNSLIDDPETVLIDTRNRYETYLGSFRGAIDPGTDSFRDFPQWVAENLDPKQHKKVAMFCTGGIRCEKSTAYLKQQGFESVFHLKGGILQYLEDVPEEQTRWEGECFVFDDRVTVDHQLQPTNKEICFNCRAPVSETDKLSEHYEKHICCPRCFASIDDDRRARLQERLKQQRLSAERGETQDSNTQGERR